MSLTQFYFSFKGRVSRSEFWIKFWLPYMALGIIIAVIDVFSGNFSEETEIGVFQLFFYFCLYGQQLPFQ